MSAARTVGVVGLGTMGWNLARNLAGRGHAVAGTDRDPEGARRRLAAHPEADVHVSDDLPGLVASLTRPRRLLLLVPAGGAVDAVLDALDPLLEEGDVVVDGGNSRWTDTDRRGARAAERPWSFVGMGISGGAEGALHGPSLMPGGTPAAWETLRPLLESIAAGSDAGPCVAWCGHGSAGHFVKTVHNGIEYAEMQHLAECELLLRRGLGLSAAEAAAHFEAWNREELESFLVEVTAGVLRTPDPQAPERPLLDAVLDRAGQKGTGRWTLDAALEHAVAVPSIAAAVEARVVSGELALRRRAAEAYGDAGRTDLEGVGPDDVRAALYAARLADHAQGFALLAAGSRERGYETDLAEVARIWRGGCIIRSRLLDDLRAALSDGGEKDGGEKGGEERGGRGGGHAAAELVLAPFFREAFGARLPAWRRVVAGAARAGLPAPGLSASLAWFDGLATARGTAALIQAQRDAFGSHGIQRSDRPDETLHADWRRGGG